MALTRKDAAATLLTALVVFVFLATHESWNVWLVGGSHRWAAGAITLLGMATCGLGTARGAVSSMALGAAAGVLAIVAIATGSLTALSLLVLVDVALWALSLARHTAHRPALPA